MVERLVRKILYWLFKDRVKVYQNQFCVSRLERTEMWQSDKFIEMKTEQAIIELAKRLLEDGIIKTKEYEEEAFDGYTYRFKIYCID